MINAHNYVPPGSGPYKYWFFCNDDWFEYKSPPTEEEMASWDWLASMNDGLIAKVRGRRFNVLC